MIAETSRLAYLPGECLFAVDNDFLCKQPRCTVGLMNGCDINVCSGERSSSMSVYPDVLSRPQHVFSYQQNSPTLSC